MAWTLDDQRESQRRYTERNREKVNAAHRAYRARTKEQRAEKRKLQAAVKIPPHTPARLRELLSYDIVSGALTRKQRLGNSPVGSRAGWVHHDGYRYIRVDNFKTAEHRVCWAIHYGVWPDHLIDHIDMDKSNNCIANLRKCTVSENICNRPAPSNNRTGFKGVSFVPARGKYSAIINKNRRRYHLGQFNTAQEAAEAYTRAMEKLHGEFARS